MGLIGSISGCRSSTGSSLIELYPEERQVADNPPILADRGGPLTVRGSAEEGVVAVSGS